LCALIVIDPIGLAIRVGENWRVYDLVIENVSLINNYRSQFNRIITSSTNDELVSRIKQNFQQIETG
jgi:phospholipid transport system substrate-binding protein